MHKIINFFVNIAIFGKFLTNELKIKVLRVYNCVKMFFYRFLHFKIFNLNQLSKNKIKVD